MKQKKWNKSINQYETEIKELSQKQEHLQRRLRGLKRLMTGKNIHIIEGEKQDRLKILWMGKDYWFHLPKPKLGGKVDNGVVNKITSKFIDDILSGKVVG
tara:strand:+ start:230 stop:529 length:300 start_codon:yes stop_codon:yes gene_type:complete